MKLFLSELFISDHQVNIIKTSITLLLYALCKMEVLVAQKEIDGTDANRAFTVLGIALQTWIHKRSVVGGGFFGKRAQDKMILLYGSTELSVSTKILVLYLL